MKSSAIPPALSGLDAFLEAFSGEAGGITPDVLVWGAVFASARRDIMARGTNAHTLRLRRLAWRWLLDESGGLDEHGRLCCREGLWPRVAAELCGCDDPAGFCAAIARRYAEERARECETAPCRRCVGCGGMGQPGTGPVYRRRAGGTVGARGLAARMGDGEGETEREGESMSQDGGCEVAP